MKAKTKRKFERIVMILLIVVFLLGWSLLLYLPQTSGTQTAPVNSADQSSQSGQAQSAGQSQTTVQIQTAAP